MHSLNPKLLNYRFNPAESVYERRVEFNVPSRPGLVSVIILRRSLRGELLRAKRAEWRTVPLTPSPKIDTMK